MGLLVSVIAAATRRMVCASVIVNDLSRSSFFFDKVTFTSANGLRGTCLWSSAQPNTVLLALSHVRFTVWAERPFVMRLLIQAVASSGMIEPALRSLKWSRMARNTYRQLSTVACVGFRSATQRSNSSQGVTPLSTPSRVGKRWGYVSGL